MDDNTLYRLLTAIISSGYIANETLYKFHGDNGILQESMAWARTIMGEKFNHSEKPKQEPPKEKAADVLWENLQKKKRL